MNKVRKYCGRKKKGFMSRISKKKKKIAKNVEVVNKKSVFNRYKNVDKIEEQLEKKRLLEQKFQQSQVEYSESEEEENPYGQLLSCFNEKTFRRSTADSEDSMSETGSANGINKESDLNTDEEIQEENEDMNMNDSDKCSDEDSFGDNIEYDEKVCM